MPSISTFFWNQASVYPQSGVEFYDGSPDFNGTTTVLGMAPSSNVYTLTQNLAAKTVTIRSGVRVKTQGYVIVCNALIIESGAFLSMNGNDATGVTGGASLLAASMGHLGFAAGSGGNGVSLSGASTTNGFSGNGSGGNSLGGVGGTGGKGGAAAGGVGNSSAILGASQLRQWRSANMWMLNWRVSPTGNTVTAVQVNGGGGGGGGGTQWTGGSGALVSGGGGGAGGIIAIRASTLSNAGTIEANGGNGANAVLGTATGGAGGGGGGSGGAIHISCDTLVKAGTMTVNGGNGGTGVGTGLSGLPGTPGTIDLFVAGGAY